MLMTGIVVVGLDEVDVGGPCAGLRVELVAIDRPAAAQLDRIVGKALCRSMVPRMRAKRKLERCRALLAHHQEGLGAGAGHHAIEQVERIGDRPRRQILVEGQRLLEQRMRKLQRVVALRDAELAEVLAPRRRRCACSRR